MHVMMAWAILHRHPLGPEVPQHSVTPCLVSGMRNTPSGRETAAQAADSPVLVHPTEAVTRRCDQATTELAIVSELQFQRKIRPRLTGSSSSHGQSIWGFGFHFLHPLSKSQRIPCSGEYFIGICPPRQIPMFERVRGGCI